MIAYTGTSLPADQQSVQRQQFCRTYSSGRCVATALACWSALQQFDRALVMASTETILPADQQAIAAMTDSQTRIPLANVSLTHWLAGLHLKS